MDQQNAAAKAQHGLGWNSNVLNVGMAGGASLQAAPAGAQTYSGAALFANHT